MAGWEPLFDGWKAAMWLRMRGSVDPAALSIVGPPSARGSIWTTPNHWLAPRRLLGRKGAAVKMKMPTAAIIISYRFMAVALPYHSQSVRVAARCESLPCQPALRVFL